MAAARQIFALWNGIDVLKESNCEDPNAFRCPENFAVCTTNPSECSMITE